MSCCIDAKLIQTGREVIDALRHSGRSVVTAESCTAGLVAACLSYGSEASQCFHGGFVVYTKAQKSVVLGVDERLLVEQGAVNAEVARQMAEGALQRSQAAIAVSITGVLGPDPDEDRNPPGLIYLGLAQRGRLSCTERYEFAPSPPDRLRQQVVLQALEALRQATR